MIRLQADGVLVIQDSSGDEVSFSYGVAMDGGWFVVQALRPALVEREDLVALHALLGRLIQDGQAYQAKHLPARAAIDALTTDTPAPEAL